MLDELIIKKTQLSRLNKNGLYNLIDKYNIDIDKLCLGFCLNNKFIDRVIVGVDSIESLKRNIEIVIDIDKYFSIINKLSNISIDNIDILFPHHWDNN